MFSSMIAVVVLIASLLQANVARPPIAVTAWHV